ncbi:hypothetical protein [Pseudoflavonifractor sp. AF19-9AC]|uniref:hypothetical protein n=1 Tax=Pseudoflavonifractor sp. AF19-9AC TaxID=2292244 RepID=UPI0011C3E452|nr:hypothetical protein [Pseudoflavonifractor sp. AF19-9AC]
MPHPKPEDIIAAVCRLNGEKYRKSHYTICRKYCNHFLKKTATKFEKEWSSYVKRNKSDTKTQNSVKKEKEGFPGGKGGLIPARRGEETQDADWAVKKES